MTTSSVSIEDYVGAIYRLQNSQGDLLPLNILQNFFGFSPISIHEMVQKLSQRGFAEYQPYHGVKLTPLGKQTAESLIRRHRIWECFLANELKVPLDETHQLAGDLEHAAPDWVSERLYQYMGEPGTCPHGSTIAVSKQNLMEIQLATVPPGQTLRITRIYPETETILALVRKLDLSPGQMVKITQTNSLQKQYYVNDRELQISGESLSCIWGVESNNES
jgi:DtxR family Mn-dependent transcriptional regulator